MERVTTVISEEKIANRIKELGAEITKDYEGKELIVVCMLKGAIYFFADLTRNIKTPLLTDFARLSSYRNGTTGGELELISAITTDIKDKHVLIVEDIIDSGKTLNYFIGLLKEKQPKSIKVCAFLDKPERREVNVKVDYCGFYIDNVFVVGYGMDYAEKYRELPYLGELHFD